MPSVGSLYVGLLHDQTTNGHVLAAMALGSVMCTVWRAQRAEVKRFSSRDHLRHTNTAAFRGARKLKTTTHTFKLPKAPPAHALYVVDVVVARFV